MEMSESKSTDQQDVKLGAFHSPDARRDQAIVEPTAQRGFFSVNLASLAGILLLTTLSLSALAYSAVFSFGQSKPRHPRRFSESQEIQSTSAGNKIAAFGAVAYLDNEKQVIDAKASVLMFPLRQPRQKFVVNSQRLFEAELIEQNPDLLSTQVERNGDYMLMRREPTELSDKQYYLLILSANCERGVPADPQDIGKLEAYFENPPELLGTRAYQLKQIRLDALEARQENVVFETQAPLPETEPVAAAPAATTAAE
jgi:hypothetical protein